MDPKLVLQELVQLEVQEKIADLIKMLDQNESMVKEKAHIFFENLKNFEISKVSLVMLDILYYCEMDKVYLFVDDYLIAFDPEHVLLRQEKLAKLVSEYLSLLKTNKILIKGLPAVFNATMKLMGEKNQFTRLHLQYIQTCIMCRNYKAALKIVDRPIVQICKGVGIQVQELICYYYFSGVCYLALKQFAKADQSFQFIQLIESRLLYDVLIETKKKMTLMNLRQGQIRQISMNEDAEYFDMMGYEKVLMGKITQKYNDLIDSTKVKNLQDLDTVLAQNIDLFSTDQNLGLVKQFKFGIIIKKLKDLKKIYSRLRIDEFTKQLQIVNMNILEVQTEINKIKPYFKVNRQNNCIEFITKDTVDQKEMVIKPLGDQLELLKHIKVEYQELNEEMIREKLKASDNYDN